MDTLKHSLLLTAKRLGLFDRARATSRSAVRILCYHGIWQGDPAYGGDGLFMRMQTFERRLELIHQLGYTVVPLQRAVAAVAGETVAMPPNPVVITIDDGWATTATRMLPVLAQRGMAATVYANTAQIMAGGPAPDILAKYVEIFAHRHRLAALGTKSSKARKLQAVANDKNRPHSERLEAAYTLARLLGVDVHPLVASGTFDLMAPELLAKVFGHEVDVQLHTHNHTLGTFKPCEISKEIRENRQVLSEILGRSPREFRHFCYPYGIFSSEAARTIASHGIDSAVTTIRGHARPGHDLHLLPRFVDEEHVSELFFESELSGFNDWLRILKRTATVGAWLSAGFSGNRTVTTATAIAELIA